MSGTILGVPSAGAAPGSEWAGPGTLRPTMVRTEMLRFPAGGTRAGAGDILTYPLHLCLSSPTSHHHRFLPKLPIVKLPEIRIY